MKICCVTRTSGGSIRMVWVLATTAENEPVYLRAFVGGGDGVWCSARSPPLQQTSTQM